MLINIMKVQKLLKIIFITLTSSLLISCNPGDARKFHLTLKIEFKKIWKKEEDLG